MGGLQYKCYNVNGINQFVCQRRSYFKQVSVDDSDLKGPTTLFVTSVKAGTDIEEMSSFVGVKYNNTLHVCS